MGVALGHTTEDANTRRTLATDVPAALQRVSLGRGQAGGRLLLLRNRQVVWETIFMTRHMGIASCRVWCGLGAGAEG